MPSTVTTREGATSSPVDPGVLGKVVRWGAVLTSVASGAVLAALLASRFVR